MPLCLVILLPKHCPGDVCVCEIEQDPMVSRIKWLDGGNLVCATGADCVRAALDWSPLSALRGGDL